MIPSGATSTGRLDFDLMGRNVVVATVDVLVLADLVEFSIGLKRLAAIDRSTLREWMIQPDDDLAVEALTFYVAGGRICVTVDGSVPYIVSDEFIATLVHLI
jgi:hypothetical protein